MKMNNKGSAILITILVVSIISLSLVTIHEFQKSDNNDNSVGTGLVLLNEQGNQDSLSTFDSLSSSNILDGQDGNINDFVRKSSSSSHKSKKSKGGSSSSSGEGSSSNSENSDSNGSDLGELSYPNNNNSPEDYVSDSNSTNDNIDFSDGNETENESNSTVGNSSQDFGEENNLSSNNPKSNLTEVQAESSISVNGACKPSSKETNEGPDGAYCNYEDYEECFDYFRKSTVYACKNPLLGCTVFDTGTDYCINSYTLNEAFLNCGISTITSDYLDWQEKNCNDYDYYSDWVYYCTSNQIRKKRAFYNYGCSNGACNIVSSGWVDDTLVSKKGYSDYCSKRKEGYNKGWTSCTLCIQGDYDCDYNSECSSSLICTGPLLDPPFGGDWDGCCQSGQRWDTTRYGCCECSSGDGSCCDGCHYRSSSFVCDYDYGSYYYSCRDGNCLDNDAFKRDRRRYCSGSSSSCSGSTEWNNPIVHETCYSWQYCDGGTSGGWQTTPTYCSSARCTSGVCCDTACGFYNYRPTSYVCKEDIMWYGCPWGNALGSDVGKKVGDRYCDSYTDACNGRIEWGSWNVKQDCNSKQYCEGDESPVELWCKAIVCSSDSDCPADYWYGIECKYNDVYGTLIDYSCKYPGTKQSECMSQQTYKKKDECGTNGYIGSNYCYDNDVYRDYVTRGCSSSSCTLSTSKILQQDCGTTGCFDGQCKGETCTNECSVGESKCNGNYLQTCGNYDVDSCLEWPSSTSGEGNKYCQYGCENAECNPNPRSDLTVTDLVVQKVSGSTVTLAFTVRNIGNAIANPVYWMVDTNSTDENPKRTSALSLDSGAWTRAYMMWTYSNPGTYNPKVIVDSDNLINESNENNNEASISVSV